MGRKRRARDRVCRGVSHDAIHGGDRHRWGTPDIYRPRRVARLLRISGRLLVGLGVFFLLSQAVWMSSGLQPSLAYEDAPAVGAFGSSGLPSSCRAFSCVLWEPAANLLDQPAFNRNRDERQKNCSILSVNARVQMDVGRTKGAAAAPSVQPNLTSVITRQAMKTVSPTIKRMA